MKPVKHRTPLSLRKVATLMVTLLLFMGATVAAPQEAHAQSGCSASFSDVPVWAYYRDAVSWAKCNGITTGTTPTTFSPNKVVTRGQMATFLYRLAGAPAVSGQTPFIDVSSMAYYSDPVKWLVAEGITNGTSPTTFSPNRAVTRGEMATFLYRFAGEPTVNYASSFSDVPAEAYYNGPINWMVDTGITNGTGNGSTFSPESNLTRAQAVTFMHRFATGPGSVAQIVDAFESFIGASGTPTVSGAGVDGRGQGYFRAKYGRAHSIAERLVNDAHMSTNLLSALATGPDVLVYRCEGRLGVFSRIDAQPSALDRSWWNSSARSCTRDPFNAGFGYFELVAVPVPLWVDGLDAKLELEKVTNFDFEVSLPPSSGADYYDVYVTNQAGDRRLEANPPAGTSTITIGTHAGQALDPQDAYRIDVVPMNGSGPGDELGLFSISIVEVEAVSQVGNPSLFSAARSSQIQTEHGFVEAVPGRDARITTVTRIKEGTAWWQTTVVMDVQMQSTIVVDGTNITENSVATVCKDDTEDTSLGQQQMVSDPPGRSPNVPVVFNNFGCIFEGGGSTTDNVSGELTSEIKDAATLGVKASTQETQSFFVGADFTIEHRITAVPGGWCWRAIAQPVKNPDNDTQDPRCY